ncbi:transposase [Catellatospora sp. TT07R-123]|uniref:RNA-guided endonuclease InsQ/TnpB family protein n=1 Tax=Catellatospora sp. TT07R-123 TaxID=2733863 RepID=UPI001B045F86|nr:RNA-guided endonuclease TnpB family protein [Catellatospora sp. TT07R-123]GHJ45441.1 transposase [Catellatospora sp. TT07R-123]
MRLRYNFRLYPTSGQRQALARAFGCARVVFNDGLRIREQARLAGEPYVTDAELSRWLTQAKKLPDRQWLGEISAVVLQQALADLNTAYRNFFRSLSGRRAGRRVGPPRLRSKRGTRQSIRFTRNANFKVLDTGRLRLPKVGDLEIRWSRELPAEPSSVTVVKDSAGRYFASFVVEVQAEELPVVDEEVGLDLGLTAYAVDSRGRIIENPRFFRRHERRLKGAYRALARKEKGSKNRAKARVKLARVHARVADSRRDWLHQETTRLIRENQAIYLEDLAVLGLARTWLAKSVYDAAWGSFRRMLESKAARYGRHVYVIGRFEPTSQVCSACGLNDGPKALSVRVWNCGSCGATHDRDFNAAKNILAAGRKLAAETRREAERLNACGAQVRPGAIPAPRSEAGTHRGAAYPPGRNPLLKEG